MHILTDETESLAVKEVERAYTHCFETLFAAEVTSCYKCGSSP